MKLDKQMRINEIKKRIDLELDNLVKAKAKGDEEQVEFIKLCISRWNKILIKEGYYEEKETVSI